MVSAAASGARSLLCSRVFDLKQADTFFFLQVIKLKAGEERYKQERARCKHSGSNNDRIWGVFLFAVEALIQFILSFFSLSLFLLGGGWGRGAKETREENRADGASRKGRFLTGTFTSVSYRVSGVPLTPQPYPYAMLRVKLYNYS